MVGVDGHGDIWKNIEMLAKIPDRNRSEGTPRNEIWQKPAKSSLDSKVKKLASYSKSEPTRCLLKDY